MYGGKSSFLGSVTIVGLLASAAAFAAPREAMDRPNFVVIFTDDQGYGDLSCYGSSVVKTPNIDRLAREGARLTSFYVAAPVCSPSRAALMTGCYPKRVSMSYGTSFPVLLAGDRKGLHPNEITIAELLEPRGYATGCFGKWHLGDQPPLLPTRQGFDEYFGIPYSHDIHPHHPRQDRFNFPPLPLLDGERVIEADPNADFLTGLGFPAVDGYPALAAYLFGQRSLLYQAGSLEEGIKPQRSAPCSESLPLDIYLLPGLVEPFQEELLSLSRLDYACYPFPGFIKARFPAGCSRDQLEDLEPMRSRHHIGDIARHKAR